MNRKGRLPGKRRRWLFLIPFVLLLLGWAVVNPLCESALRTYLDGKLRAHNSGDGLVFSFQELDLDILQQRLTLHGVHAGPPEQDSLEHGVRNMRISQATLHGIGLSNFLWNKNLDIHRIHLDSVVISVHKTAGKAAPPEPAERAHPILPDSILLPGISGVSLGDFELEYFGLAVLSPEGSDTLTHFRGNGLRLHGIAMRPAGEKNPAFVPDLTDMVFELDRQEYVLGGGMYSLGFDHLRYEAGARTLRMDQLTYAPAVSHEELAGAHTQSFERYLLRFKTMEFRQVGLLGLLMHGGLHIGAIEVDSLHAEIFRDKTKPFNTAKAAKLPIQALEGIQFPLRVDTVLLVDSYLKYSESLPDTEQEVAVDFQDLQGQFLNIHSAEGTTNAPGSLHLGLSTNLLGAIPVSMQVELPYRSHRVSLRGHTKGNATLAALNPTVYPAMNMRFEGGRLDGIEFHATGTTHQLSGELTMLYTDLDVSFLNDSDEEKKTLSWAVNALVKHSNPNRRGKTVVGQIQTERVPYKGLGNFIWKAIQSGVVNSLNPVGKHHRE